jgi:hypothetical protein
VLLMAALLTGCGREGQEPVRLHGTVVRPPRDTVRVALPATFRMCEGGRALLLESIDPRGDGVLTLVRYGDSLTSKTYPILMSGDTLGVGAAVGIRYLVRDVPRAFALDSGGVEIRWDKTRITAHVQGTGIENAVRTRATIDYRDVERAAGSDSLPCRYGR